MNEIERIIKKGNIKEDFLKEEIICDYKVDSKIKKIWAVELDLLLEFDKFCNKFKLQYFLAFGTLLGAVRHNGFIPWDDDIDVMMFRDDYNKLINYINYFNYPYFLQTEKNDNNYGFSFYKLRNSNTTAISYKFMFSKMNEGIFLDIFPIDNFKYDEASKKDFELIKSLNYDNSTIMRKDNPFLDDADNERVKEYFDRNNRSIKDNIQLINDIATKFNNCNTSLCSTRTCTFYDMNKYIFEKKDFEDVIFLNYCGFKFPAPIGYKNILRVIYDDYMKFPPIEKRGIIHSGAYFDADEIYTNSINKIMREGDNSEK